MAFVISGFNFFLSILLFLDTDSGAALCSSSELITSLIILQPATGEELDRWIPREFCSLPLTNK